MGKTQSLTFRASQPGRPVKGGDAALRADTAVAMCPGEGEPCFSSLSARPWCENGSYSSKAAAQFSAGAPVNTEQVGEPGAADKPDLPSMRQMPLCAVSPGPQARDALSV